MELSLEQQIFEQIRLASKILIALPESLSPDAVSSGLGLALFLKKLDKDAVVASSGFLPENLKFLPESGKILSDIGNGQSLVVSVNTAVKKLDEISYQASDSKVSIFLKAKDGPFAPEDISFSQEKFPVSLLIILDCKSFEDLGKLFENNSDLFFETPKINIDNKAGNEYFGAINLVDVTATSVAEILSALLQKLEGELVDEDIATCLLTGIIARTHSFQHAQTTPKAFLKASELITLGGRQQEIIKHIFKTKSLSLLKLWGRALAKLKQVNGAAVYAVLAASDFDKAEASGEQALQVLKELAENVSGYNVVGIIAEPPGASVTLLAALHAQIEPQKFIQQFEAGGKALNGASGPYKIVRAEFSGSLQEAETKFIRTIKEFSGVV